MKDDIRQELIQKKLVVPNAKPTKSAVCSKCNKAYEILSDWVSTQCGNCECKHWERK